MRILLYKTRFLIVLCLFLSDCKKEEIDYEMGEYWVNLATVRLLSNKTTFLLDNGTSLFNGGKAINTQLSDSQRVQISYSILPEISTPGFDHTIQVNYVAPINQGILRVENQQSMEQIKQDPIVLQSAAIGSHYLNIRFQIDFFSVRHNIYLYTDSTSATNDTVQIAFIHTRNEDTRGSLRNIVASFDLEKTLGTPNKDKVLMVNFNTINYGDTILLFNY